MTNVTTTNTLQPLLDELQQQVQAHYQDRLASVVLFGSQARGDAETGSDIDILIVLYENELAEDKTFTRDVTYKMLLRYDMLVSLLHTSLDRYLHEQSPLMINVRHEGIVLTNGAMNHLLQTAMQHSQKREDTMTLTSEQATLVQRATEELEVTRTLYIQGFYHAAISRSYYTMFYVAQAFLLGKGMSFSKHSAVIAAFGKHIAHPGIVPIALHRYLIDAQDARLTADYAPEAILTEEDVTPLIGYAETFLNVAKQILQ